MRRKSRRCMLVDDEQEIVDFMARFLQRWKIASIKATSGEEALEAYDRQPAEIVFLDIQLGGIDGFAVLQELRTKNPSAKVIMLTGTVDKAVRERALSMGAVDYICKPIDLYDFKKKLQKYITI